MVNTQQCVAILPGERKARSTAWPHMLNLKELAYGVLGEREASCRRVSVGHAGHHMTLFVDLYDLAEDLIEGFAVDYYGCQDVDSETQRIDAKAEAVDRQFTA